MKCIDELGLKIMPASIGAMDKARDIWFRIAKPIGSLGLLEDVVVKLAGIYADADFNIDKRCAVIVCSDNGVVKEGVSQTDSSVTSSVALDICRGTSNINVMAKAAGTDTYAVDMGMINEVNADNIIDCHIRRGTDNIANGPAMTRHEAIKAINEGISLVKRMKESGYKIIVTGEMGIGNTTTSSALAAVLLEKSVEDVTGRGAGLDDEGLNRKIDTIKKAINVNNAVPEDDAITLISKLGGFDIAAMTGMFLGGAVYNVPVIIDGFISGVAALLAYEIDHNVKDYMLASHISNEPAGIAILNKLSLKAIIHGEMRLGEGTGAVCLLPLLDIAVAEYKCAHRFADTDIEQYEVLS